RDAFSGVVLWKKTVGPWEGHMRRFRSGPTELPRRLVAVGERVYVTLGYGKPVSVLDAATGETSRTLAGTEGAVEIVCDGRTVYVVIGRTGERKIAAFSAATGERAWGASGAETRDLMPQTLCASGGSVFYQNATHVVRLDAATGGERWRAARPVKRNRFAYATPTLVAVDGIVLSADCAPGPAKGKDEGVKWQVTSKPKRGDDSMGEIVAFSATDGRELWRAPSSQGYTSPPDVFVAEGIVWTGTAPVRNTTDFTEGRDLRTGEVRKRLDTEAAFASAHHHRCYRPKATERYILVGRTGTEFIDLAGGEPSRNHWARGACQYGVLPANGLLYLPQHSCACYIQSKLSGFWALAPKRTAEYPTPRGPRLTRGPAWSAERGQGRAAREDDWPTHRHDTARSGRSMTRVPAKLAPAWEARIGGRPTAPVIAEGVALVASADGHFVQALDAGRGAELWRFTAGGRIDSPPTVHEGLAVFGSADGHVYCLRLSDGILVWRFRAAPRDRRTVAFGQVESVWPVTGSVLVREGVVYCTAGRSSYLDGGMYLHRLSVRTGELIGTRRLYDRDPATGAQPEDRMEDVELPGALPDVLSCDGENLYLRDKRMSLDGKEDRPPTVAHLYCSAGLLDGEWWHRTYWLWGERTFGRASGWHIIPAFQPSGRILVFDEETVFGYGRKKVSYGGTDLGGCHLFRALKRVEPRPGTLKNNNKALVRILRPAKVKYRWSRETPFIARAMVLAGGVLFAAGPAREGKREPSFDGAGKALLMAFAAKDGAELSRLELDSQPVFDGLAAARGRLYVTTLDGRLICLGGATP
ncbi:MAG: outer membrane protein assembly factor BamB family protein, partial [Planctomycetota bacterium]